jgi:putative Mg2+ transporter-C (MgtC) family protein
MTPAFDLSLTALFIQMAIAAGLGLALGAERTIAGKVAGMRTFALVSLGSCLFIITSVVVTQQYIGLVSFDPMRVAAGIISGIGFIGAGLILFKENALRGLTTAAGLWIASGVGIAVGFQLYAVATFATVLTLFVFTAVWFIEDTIRHKYKRTEPAHVESLMTTDQEIDE